MRAGDIRGYVVALSLVGFTGAWAAAAHEVAPKQTADTKTQNALRKQAAWLTAQEKRLKRDTVRINRLIAKRRADAKKPRPIRYVKVYVGGGGGGGGGYRGGGGSSSGGGGGGGGYTPAPVSVAPVASSGSS